jgi:hypothetical protein
MWNSTIQTTVYGRLSRFRHARPHCPSAIIYGRPSKFISYTTHATYNWPSRIVCIEFLWWLATTISYFYIFDRNVINWDVGIVIVIRFLIVGSGLAVQNSINVNAHRLRRFRYWIPYTYITDTVCCRVELSTLDSSSCCNRVFLIFENFSIKLFG